MRRLLPVFFCVAASTGLAACDHEPVGPADDEIFYDAARAAPFPVPANVTDGNVTLSRPAGGGGGVDIVVFDIVDSVSRDSTGTAIQVLSPDVIASPQGQVLCTRGQSGGFVQLRDADGDVLMSSVGPLVFDGQPNLAGKNFVQQAVELANHLRFSFDFTIVVEGTPSTGEDLVSADVAIQFSSGWRKLTIAALVDGYCGSDGLPQ